MNVSIYRGLAASALVVLIAGCQSSSTASNSPASTTVQSATLLPVVAVPGYTVPVFTRPDSSESAS